MNPYLVKPEPTNAIDNKAVAVLKDDLVVGHVPYNLASRLFQFLRRDVNKSFAEVTVAKVNRGAGYGLASTAYMALQYTYIERMRELVDSLITAGHL